ncbi:lysine biosynthesis protein LysX [Pyrococcus abyssi]|uniref:Ribosomal protein s6 modification protein n=1 Tax=Pyrococcus abyssi (strain GE5 / Orsay) TaxID=272844 RepID=Q9V1I7_PYRAB|nr:lysine biosynthesis protein LysX [Pyrococcus abyssi]CAB49362.1 rimK ribosomal protein S6 modification protein [Pyrococcus abyssi GE5]CCE69822.1 TPA: ribosomal protein s6 modification protein [Pyrococcus abyssi GE5]
MRIGITYSVLRREEIMIKERAKEFGEVVMLHEDELIFPGEYDVDVVIIRNLSHFKSLYIAKLFENHGIPTINPFNVILEAGDKVFATLKLAKKVPVPRWGVALSENSASKLAKDMEFPVVSKPVFGSWGRLLAKINDEDALEAVLEHRKWMKNPLYNIHYMQEYIEKPGRDIRSYVIGGEFVTAIYRYSDHWVTNTARGGRAEPCFDERVIDVSIKAWEAFGEGALAIDIFETKNELLVNEVNPNMEFKNAARVTGVDIARKLVEYAVEVAKR